MDQSSLIQLIMAPREKKGNSEPVVFDPKDRIDFVKGFPKRKQEMREHAKQKAQARDREIARLLRQKRKDAREKARGVQRQQVNKDEN